MVSAATFGETLRKKREEAGISLRRLAHLVSYSPGWVSRVENGLVSPTLQMARLCDRQLSADGELVALAHSLLASPQRELPPVQVPRDTDGLIGRERELQFLDHHLDRSRKDSIGMLVSIEGNVGLGKTATAVRWAHRRAEFFEDGVLFADMQGYSNHVEPLAAEEVLEGFLTALGVDAVDIPASLNQRAAFFRTLTARRRILIVLDNAAGSLQVQPLLPSWHSCAVVVTSRRRLTALAVRNKAVPLPLGPLAAHDAVDVLKSFADDTRGNSEAAAYRVLAGQCGSVPLALRIAGNRLAASGRVQDLVRDLANPATRLDLLSDTEDTTLSIRSALERSYCELDRPAARMFQLLGLTQPGLTALEAAALSDWSVSRSQRALESLTDIHLAYHGDGRYTLDELSSVLAAEKAAAEETEEARMAALERPAA
ncbi:helix-turn-helix domain-containing protein [Streptomyces rishiriensis]|uniref:helix-turn-helix domain-containing protein n=1 Tax=Streptomyces rishiriensis TaxID=68264 RepID=UPI0037B4B11E